MMVCFAAEKEEEEDEEEEDPVQWKGPGYCEVLWDSVAQVALEFLLVVMIPSECLAVGKFLADSEILEVLSFPVVVLNVVFEEEELAFLVVLVASSFPVLDVLTFHLEEDDDDDEEEEGVLASLVAESVVECLTFRLVQKVLDCLWVLEVLVCLLEEEPSLALVEEEEQLAYLEILVLPAFQEVVSLA